MVWEGTGGYGAVWGDLGAFEGGTGWYGTGFPRKFLNRPVASTSLIVPFFVKISFVFPVVYFSCIFYSLLWTFFCFGCC